MARFRAIYDLGEFAYQDSHETELAHCKLNYGIEPYHIDALQKN